MGMLFAGRRTAIDPDQFDLICREDALRKLSTGERPELADVVAYRQGDDVIHVGLIAGVLVTADPRPGAHLEVLSQWGFDGEYFHRGDFLPPGMLTAGASFAVEVWTDRK